VQGTRDPMGPIDLFTDLVADHESESLRLRIVMDGDHSLECRKRPLRARGQTQDDVDDEILYDLRRFVESICG
jgi:predicted alpha/beta-hydrolase family hydrolase